MSTVMKGIGLLRRLQSISSHSSQLTINEFDLLSFFIKIYAIA